MKIKLNRIRIPENRQRQVINSDRIATLAVSMNGPAGQLHPITVIVDGENFSLIAGYRRVLAARQLKWEEIEAEVKENLTPLELEEIELDENLQRDDLSYQEECKAKLRMLVLRKKLYGEGVDEVSEHIGEAKTTFWEDARLAQAAEVIPELFKAKNKSQAQAKLRLAIRREALMVMAEKRSEEKGKDWGTVAENVHLGDCLQVMRGFTDGCVSLVLLILLMGLILMWERPRKVLAILSSMMMLLMILWTLWRSQQKRLSGC